MPYDHDAPVGLMGSRLYVEGPPQQPDTIQQQQQQQQDMGKLEKGEQRQQDVDDRKGLAVKQEGGSGDGEGLGGGTAAAAGSGKPPLPPAR
jgi:hypothetical protein